MDELISRQAAIDALKVAYFDEKIQSGKDDPCVIDAMTDWSIRQIKALPSAQPDLSDYSDKLWKAAYERGKAEAEQRGIPWEKLERYAEFFCADVPYTEFVREAKQFCLDAERSEDD